MVNVDDAEAGVEADGEAGEPGLGFEDRVQVVEDRVGRVDRETRATGEQRSALAEAEPMLGNVTLAWASERDRDWLPGAPIGEGGVAFCPEELVERACLSERGRRPHDPASCRLVGVESLERLGLSVELRLQQHPGDLDPGLAAADERL